MTKKRAVPEVRFKGFEGEWEEKSLGEVVSSLQYGLNAPAVTFDGKNKYIRITDIDDKSRRFIEESVTSPGIDLANAENYVVNEGDVLFARTGASVGKSFFYDKSYGKLYFAGFLIRATITISIDSYFVSLLSG